MQDLFEFTVYPRQFHYLNANSKTILSLKKGPVTIGQLKKKVQLIWDMKQKILTRACGGPPPFGGLRIECRITSPSVLQAKAMLDAKLRGGLGAFCNTVSLETGTRLELKLLSVEDWLWHFHRLWSRVMDQGLLDGADDHVVSADKFRAYHDLEMVLGINGGNIGGNWSQEEEFAWYAQDAEVLEHTGKHFLPPSTMCSCTRVP